MANIDEVEETKKKRQNIRLPKWYRVVRFVRRTQVPREFRAVFDIESDPQYRNIDLAEKVSIANDKAESWMKGEEYEVITEESYLSALAYINGHHQVKEASQIQYQNLKMSNAMRDNFDSLVEKAMAHSDPTKMINLSREIRRVNENYAFMNENKLLQLNKRNAKKEEPKTHKFNLPKYMRDLMKKQAGDIEALEDDESEG
ncbi:MAG: hypothetical protein ACHQ6U_12330 [Thermodesulfobacteriota bacterium]